MLKTLTVCQNLAKVNDFHIYAKIYVLFLATAAMFFNESKIEAKTLCKIPYGTITQNFMLIHLALSEETIFKTLLQN